VILGASVTVIL